MSVIRHSPVFHRHVSRDGRTHLFRESGNAERVLFIGNEKIAREVKTSLEQNFFEVHTADRGAKALQAILENDFSAVICDTGLANFPVDTFYVALERIRPSLISRLIFLVDEHADESTVEFIDRVDGLKVWRPIEVNELFQMIEIVIGQTEVAQATA